MLLQLCGFLMKSVESYELLISEKSNFTSFPLFIHFFLPVSDVKRRKSFIELELLSCWSIWRLHRLTNVADVFSFSDFDGKQINLIDFYMEFANNNALTTAQPTTTSPAQFHWDNITNDCYF